MKKLRATWASMHKGVVYGRFPLLEIPIEKWVICLLHMNLRIVGGMFNALVRDMIGSTPAEGQNQPVEISALLTQNGIWMKESRLQPQSKSLNEKQLQKISFIGVDTEKITHICEQLQSIVQPKSKRDEDRLVEAQYVKSMDVWTYWKSIWRLLNDAIDSNNKTECSARADAVQSAADLWLKAWVRAHKKTQGLYIHILVHHLSDMVRRYGDLRPYQSQGLEHTHSQRKRAALTLTNRRAQSATCTIARTEQLLTHVVAEDHTRKRQRHNLDQQKHAQLEKTKKARVEARVKQLYSQGVVKVV